MGMGTGRLRQRQTRLRLTSVWQGRRKIKCGTKWPDLKELADDGAEDAQRPLVFEAFGGLIEFLQGHFGVSEQFVVIDELPNAAFALIYLLQDVLQAARGVSEIVVNALVLEQLADRAAASIHIANGQIDLINDL